MIMNEKYGLKVLIALLSNNQATEFVVTFLLCIAIIMGYHAFNSQRSATNSSEW